jgi:hypothetical protein
MSSESGAYMPPVIGNGEIVTFLSPSGYNADLEHYRWFQHISWAGRRYDTPVSRLVRLGRFMREISVNGQPSRPERWEQEVAPGEGVVRSTLHHHALREETVTFVHLLENAILARTELTNTFSARIAVVFELEYGLRDYMGIAPDVGSVTVEPAPGGASLRYEIEKHVGAVEVRTRGDASLTPLDRGCRLHQALDLTPGETRAVEFLIGFGDRTRYYAVPIAWGFDDMLDRHAAAWREFHQRSQLDLGAPEIEALRAACLYSIRSQCTPWSIPPGLSPATWDGRTFHDELYPSLALMSAGHLDLGARPVRYRLHTLDQALERTGWRGARFPWESNEDGTEGGSYGAWMDEHFHMGQFAENAWRHALYSNDAEALAEVFSLLAGIADYFLLNMIERRGGRARIRPCTDYDETIHPVPNGLYTMCAAIRSMELAAQSAAMLGRAEGQAARWRAAAAELRESIPVTPDGARYCGYDGAPDRHIAELGPIFPFRIDEDSALARATVADFVEALRSDVGWKPGTRPEYDGSRWMWIGSHLATCLAIQGEGNRAFAVLRETAQTAGPGLAPVEQTHADGRVNCPWFTTSAGAFVNAVHSLLVQVDDDATWLLPALPTAIERCSADSLAGRRGIRIALACEGRRITELSVHSPIAQQADIIISDDVDTGDLLAGREAATEHRRGRSCRRWRVDLGVGENRFPR